MLLEAVRMRLNARKSCGSGLRAQLFPVLGRGSDKTLSRAGSLLLAAVISVSGWSFLLLVYPTVTLAN